MNSILFGNGLNLLSEDCPSWKELLSDISDKDNAPILEGIPPTLQYEQVYLSPNTSFSGLTNKTEETTLKNAVKRRLRKLHSNDYYERLRSMDVNVFLTTNYDHAFYDNDEGSVVNYDGTEKLYSIRRWKRLMAGSKESLIYHIHGDIKGVSSIMLGLDHYGGSLAKIQDYVKGNYQRTRTISGKKVRYKVVPSIRERLKNGSALNASDYEFKDSGYPLFSWIDAFFFTNMHIIGLAIDFSEIDIWWILSRRARLLKSGLLNNRIWYYPTFTFSEIHRHIPKLRLLERLGVDIAYHSITSDIETGIPDYPAIYDQQLRQLNNNL